MHEALGMLLEGEGYIVARAVNGAEACRILEGGLRPDVIVLDVMMPVMSGLEYLTWHEASPYAAIPIVLFSASMTVDVKDYKVPVLSKTADIAAILKTLAAATE